MKSDLKNNFTFLKKFMFNEKSKYNIINYIIKQFFTNQQNNKLFPL